MSATKKITIRLYKRHDMDLITLYKTPGFSLHKAIYSSLKAYINKNIYLIKMPKTTIDMTMYEFRSHYQLCLSFDYKKDADILNWFKTLKPNMRTQAIKAVLRGCLIGTTVFACIKNDADRTNNIIMTKKIEEFIPVLSKTPLTAKAEKQKEKETKQKQKNRDKKSNRKTKIENQENDNSNKNILKNNNYNNKEKQIKTNKQINEISGFGDNDFLGFGEVFNSNEDNQIKNEPSNILNNSDDDDDFDMLGSINALLNQM